MVAVFEVNNTNGGNKINYHDGGCPANFPSNQVKNSTDKLCVGRKKGSCQWKYNPICLQEISEFQHPFIRENIILRSVNEVKPNQQKNKECSIGY